MAYVPKPRSPYISYFFSPPGPDRPSVRLYLYVTISSKRARKVRRKKRKRNVHVDEIVHIPTVRFSSVPLMLFTHGKRFLIVSWMTTTSLRKNIKNNRPYAGYVHNNLASHGPTKNIRIAFAGEHTRTLTIEYLGPAGTCGYINAILVENPIYIVKYAD